MNKLTHFGRELLLIGLGALDELQAKTVSQHAISADGGKPKPRCQNYKKPGHYKKYCHQF